MDLMGRRTTIWNYGSGYSYVSSNNPLGLFPLFDISKDKDQFPSKKELWNRAKRLIEEQDKGNFYLIYDSKRWRIEEKVFELFIKELENVVNRWTGSLIDARNITEKIIKNFELKILNYLGISHRCIYPYIGYRVLSPIMQTSVFDSHCATTSDFMIEQRISESLSLYLSQLPEENKEYKDEEFIPYPHSGTINSDLDWDQFVDSIFSRLRIITIRTIVKKRISEIAIQNQIPSIFLPTISFMQTKASLA